MLTLSFCVAFSWFWSLDCATHPWWFSSSDLFFAIKYTLIKSFHLLNRIDFVPFFVMDFHNFTTTTKYCRESFHRFTAILLFSLRRRKKGILPIYWAFMFTNYTHYIIKNTFCFLCNRFESHTHAWYIPSKRNICDVTIWRQYCLIYNHTIYCNSMHTLSIKYKAT